MYDYLPLYYAQYIKYFAPNKISQIMGYNDMIGS